MPSENVQSWKVPVERVAVCLRFAGDDERCGEVFLQTATAAGRPQTIQDLLNDETHFLPLLHEDQVELIHKDELLWVEGDPTALLPPDEGIPPVEHPVSVELSDGEVLEGNALVVAPPGHQRVLDLLNGPEPFFVLGLDDRFLILHKNYVRSIRTAG